MYVTTAGQSESVPMAIVAAVTDVHGTTPAELDFVVEDYVPSDAIRTLAAHDDASWSLTFALPEHTVTVTSDDVVRVEERHRESIDGTATELDGPTQN